MRKHRSMTRMGEMEESKLMGDTQFRITFIRLLKNLLKTFEKLDETSKKLGETFNDLNKNTKKRIGSKGAAEFSRKVRRGPLDGIS